eukprot:01716_1
MARKLLSRGSKSSSLSAMILKGWLTGDWEPERDSFTFPATLELTSTRIGRKRYDVETSRTYVPGLTLKVKEPSYLSGVKYFPFRLTISSLLNLGVRNSMRPSILDVGSTFCAAVSKSISSACATLSAAMNNTAIKKKIGCL